LHLSVQLVGFQTQMRNKN